MVAFFLNFWELIAGALLTGNYGMWNAYVIVMMILYAPPAAKGKMALLKFMTKIESDHTFLAMILLLY